MADRPADDSEIGNAGVDAAALQAEIEALRQRLAALEARLAKNGSAEPPELRHAIRQRRPRSKTDAELEPDAAGWIARRRALGLGALASLFAFIGRSAARAADALSIGPDGKIGIGTTTPAATLDVVGGLLHVADNTGAPTVTSQGAYLGWNALNRGTGETDFINNQGAGSGGFAFMNTPLSGTPRNTLMFMSGAGNVGIGTTSPKDKLDVNGSATTTGLNVAGSATMTELNVTGSASITGLKVPGMGITGSNALEFGAGVGGKQVDAGKIGYEKFTTDALDIVGAGTDGSNRKIKFWAEGGATFDGSLNVSGSVQLGSSPGVSAAGGKESLRMLRGIVAGDGNKFAGEGFDVRKSDTGLYDIAFDQGFPSVPGASATQILGSVTKGNAAATATGSTSPGDFANIVHLSADRMRVGTWTPSGRLDRYFSFIVIGPR
jgi:hypothetical protein